ncbi:MAG: OmpA family protein [Deltaproteobacteria bacterium]|nr:OmpA family protein [Deltaproteobacteria bacterium]
MGIRRAIIGAVCGALLPLAAHAVTFTGNAGSDFAAGACLADPGGQDIVWGTAQTGLQFSGFDLHSLCIGYDTTSDLLQLGILTRDPTTGADYITGDADRDGDPGVTGSALQKFPPAKDLASFGPLEFFAAVLDFDFDVTNGFDAVVGKTSLAALSAFGVFTATTARLDDAVSGALFGPAVAAAAGSAVFNAPAGPDAGKPHLEFDVASFSAVPGAAGLDLTDPNATMGLFFILGSLSDGPIGEDYFPGATGTQILYGLQPITTAHLLQLDNDGDSVIDDLDRDDDGDGIPDLIEWGLKSCDLNGDGILSVSQDADGDGTFDVGEEGELKQCALLTGGKEFIHRGAFPGGVYPDFDGDGIPNYLDTDSDNDGFPDGTEDLNHNGVVDAGESDPLDPLSVPVASASDEDDEDEEEEAETEAADPVETVEPAPEPPVPAATPCGLDVSTLDGDLAGCDPSAFHAAGAGLTSCALVPAVDNLPQKSRTLLLLFAFHIGCLAALRIAKRRHVSAAYALTHFSAYALLLGFSGAAHALNVQRAHAPTNGSGGVHQDDAYTLGRGRWSLGLQTGFTKRPFQVSAATTNQRVDGLVESFVTQELVAAYGLTDWLDVAVSAQSNLTADVETFGATAASRGADLGDLLLAAKFQFLNQVYDDSRFGVTFIPFLTLPTGNSDRYFGDSSVSGGLKTVLDRYWGRTLTYASLGARFREREDFLNMTAAHELLFGAGAQHPVAPALDLYLLGEIDGSTTFRKFASQEASSPIEFNGGVRKYWMGGRLATTASAGIGISSGYGAPRWRAALALQFAPRTMRDRDEDGVRDAVDRCPTDPADPSLPSERLGCPPPGSPRLVVKIVGDRILILQPINFVTGSATIMDDSLDVVEQVAALLKATPELKQVLVEGHTDNVGGTEYNQRLADARARSVVEALVAHGVVADRLKSKGWGLTKPLTTNETETGRAKNRRVEFHILDFQQP